MPLERGLRRIGESLVAVEPVHHVHEHRLAVAASADEHMALLAVRLIERVEHHLLEEVRIPYAEVVDGVEELGDGLERVWIDFEHAELGILSDRILDVAERLQVHGPLVAPRVEQRDGVADDEVLGYREVSLEVGLDDVRGLQRLALVGVHIVRQQAQRLVERMQLVVLAHVHHVAFEQDQLCFDEVGDLGVDVLGVRSVRIERVEPSLEYLLHRHVEGVRADRLLRQRFEKPGLEVPRLHDRVVHLDSFLTWMAALPEKRKALHLEERGKPDEGLFKVPSQKGSRTPPASQDESWRRSQRDAARLGRATSQHMQLYYFLAFSATLFPQVRRLFFRFWQGA